MSAKQQPVKKFKAGQVAVAVWKNDEHHSYSVTCQRVYKDGEEWKETTSFFVGDLPVVQELMRCAFIYIINNPIEHNGKARARR